MPHPHSGDFSMMAQCTARPLAMMGLDEVGPTMSSSPNQGMLASIPAGCCACGNTAFPACDGAEVQPDPPPSMLLVTFLPEEVLPWGSAAGAHTV